MVTGKSFSLTREERIELERVLRQRKADGLIVRRANALLLLDDGIGAIEVARVLYLDAETIRDWRRHFLSHGMRFLFLSPYSKREGHLSFKQEGELKAHLSAWPPRSTNEVSLYIQNSYGQEFSPLGVYQTDGAAWLCLQETIGFCRLRPMRASSANSSNNNIITSATP